jgi:hypothetical protein
MPAPTRISSSLHPHQLIDRHPVVVEIRMIQGDPPIGSRTISTPRVAQVLNAFRGKKP